MGAEVLAADCPLLSRAAGTSDGAARNPDARVRRAGWAHLLHQRVLEIPVSAGRPQSGPSDVIYGGVAPEKFFSQRSRADYSDGPLRLLYAGYIDEKRGLHTDC